MASQKCNRIRQLKAGSDSSAHPVKPVAVGNEMTFPNGIGEFWDPECPHYTDDLYLAFVETRGLEWRCG
jgi:hypothetical protein